MATRPRPTSPTITFDKGLNTSVDPSALQPGELTVATGCEYRPSSNHLYKLPGRSDTGQHLGAIVQGIANCEYNIGTDTLVAVAGGSIYESAVSTSPSFGSAQVTGLSTSSDPWFAGIQDRWLLCNGVDSNRIRENATTTASSNGNWRVEGLVAPTFPSVITLDTSSSFTTVRPTGSASNTRFSNPANAYDAKSTTYAFSQATTGNTNSIIYTFAAGTTITGDLRLYVDATLRTGLTKTHLKLEYSEDGGTTWTTFADYESPFGANDFAQYVTPTTVNGSLSNMSNLKLRITHTGQGNLYVWEIWVSNGGTGHTLSFPIYYTYTEGYRDSDGKVLESVSFAEPVSVTDVASNIKSVTLTLPGLANLANASVANAQPSGNGFVRIYRSVDESGGGYPVMWRIAEVDAAATSFTDDLTNATAAGTELLDYLTFQFADGSTATAESNYPPPLASMALPFQGSMVYNSVVSPDKLYYSKPVSISPMAIEQVPTNYYLEFMTGTNDDITSIALCNGGRVLLVYFAKYTMLVSYLPQATDSGVFDNRVKEYITNQRGAAGRFCTAEFTIEAGSTMVAAVDSDGMWVTNGVNVLQHWSHDIDWDTMMASVDLSAAKLYNNAPKHRLELLYTDGNGNRAELHWFYNRMKKQPDGGAAPLITGPHPPKVSCRLHTIIAGKWESFSGDSTATGAIYLEGGDADASNGYDSNGTVPFDVQTGDFYITGLGRAHLLEMGHPKWGTGTKDVTLTGTFTRDGGSTHSVTKTYSIGTQKKVYWHRYADRHSLRITDATSTSLPSLVAYELEVRDAGVARDE